MILAVIAEGQDLRSNFGFRFQVGENQPDILAPGVGDAHAQRNGRTARHGNVFGRNHRRRKELAHRYRRLDDGHVRRISFDVDLEQPVHHQRVGFAEMVDALAKYLRREDPQRGVGQKHTAGEAQEPVCILPVDQRRQIELVKIIAGLRTDRCRDDDGGMTERPSGLLGIDHFPAEVQRSDDLVVEPAMQRFDHQRFAVDVDLRQQREYRMANRAVDRQRRGQHEQGQQHEPRQGNHCVKPGQKPWRVFGHAVVQSRRQRQRVEHDQDQENPRPQQHEPAKRVQPPPQLAEVAEPRQAGRDGVVSVLRSNLAQTMPLRLRIRQSRRKITIKIDHHRGEGARGRRRALYGSPWRAVEAIEKFRCTGLG